MEVLLPDDQSLNLLANVKLETSCENLHGIGNRTPELRSGILSLICGSNVMFHIHVFILRVDNKTSRRNFAAINRRQRK